METMTLREAFKTWGQEPGNATLATRSREAVRKVLMKHHEDMTLDEVTPGSAREIFLKSGERQELKIKAASILVHLLEWGAGKGCCRKPAFTYQIASEESLRQETKEEAPKEQTEQENSTTTEKETTMEKEKTQKGRAPRKVCRLDAATLQVTERYDSIKEACARNGIRDLCGALRKHQKAGGHYWCYDGEEKTFSPSPRACVTKKEKPVTAAATAERTHQTKRQKSLADYTDNEIAEEIIRRGWKGTFSFTTTIELK